jgi:hypothetical protein
LVSLVHPAPFVATSKSDAPQLRGYKHEVCLLHNGQLLRHWLLKRFRLRDRSVRADRSQRIFSILG